MKNITRTVYGGYVQSIQLNRGQVFEMKEFTTLNEKFGIQAGVAPGANVIPQLGYYVIGLGGHSYTVGADGIPVTKRKQHETTDASLFKHIPFALRLTTNDLSETERAKYCLRKTVQYNGNNYYAYFGKRLNMAENKTTLEYRTVANGVTTISAFTPTSDNLNPVAKEVDTSGVNTTTGDYVSASTKANLSLTADEVAEIINACKIIYGDEDHAIISELALVTGVDKVISATSSSGSINFNEVIAAQCYVFYNVKVELQDSTNGYNCMLDVGNTEPLFNIN